MHRMFRLYIALLFIITSLLAACGGQNTNSPDLGVLPTRVTLVSSTPRPTQTPAAPVGATPVARAQTAGGVLRFWEAAGGTLNPQTADRWTFDALAGDAITVRVLGVQALLTLQAADGRVIQTDRSIQATLPADGTYTVVVQTLQGEDGGPYEIGLGYAGQVNPNAERATLAPEVVGVPTPTPPYTGLGSFIDTLADGETIGGTLTDSGSPHIYTFSGSTGEFVRLEMRRVSGEIDPRLTLYSPNGQAIATDDDSLGDAGALLRNVRLPTDGLYSVQAAGGSPGGYSVTLFRTADIVPVTPTVPAIDTATPIPTYGVPSPAPVVAGNRLEDHAPVRSFIDGSGYLGIFPLYAGEGEAFTVGAGPVDGSAVRLRIEVVNPDGAIVPPESGPALPGQDGDTLVTPIRADAAGVYQVFVASVGDETQTGPFIVGYGRGSTWLNVMAGEPDRDVGNQGVIRRRGARDIWTLRLDAGDIITAGVTPGDPRFDPILEIAPADSPDTPLAVDDNGGGDRAAFIQRVDIPRTGVYLLRVRASQAATTGPYSLVWRYINVAPTPTPPPATYPLLTLDDSVPAETYRFYTFYGRADQRIQIDVTGQSAGFDPVLALIAPDGSTIAEADDSNGTLNPSLTVTLPAEGTYQVRVNGYLSAGDFLLTVLELFD